MSERSGQRRKRIAVGERIAPLALATLSGTVEMPAAGRLTHLQFRRFAGCPICDLHLRSFARRHAEVARAGITEIVLFHSDEAALRTYGGELPFLLVADPGKRHYAQFGVEAASRALRNPRVWPYVLLGVLRSFVRVLRRRQAMPPISPQGGSLGLPADFLIGSDGVVLACKYGEYAYDQWSVDELLDHARAAVPESAGREIPAPA